MNFLATSIPDVITIEPVVFKDERGFFMETFNEKKFREAGIDCNFVQDNHSRSRQGTLRGLHYQIRQSQGKLVRVVLGEVFDVAVDIRRSSPTYGQWVSCVLSAENKLQLWIPPGFAHGFLTLTPWAEMVYKATDFYAPQYERTILWNDETLSVAWQVPPGGTLLLSSKDLQGARFDQAEVYD